MSEIGPMYGGQILDESFPVFDGTMTQEMPSARDLKKAQKTHARLVAGYEVLCSHYFQLKAENEKLKENNLPKQIERLREQINAFDIVLEAFPGSEPDDDFATKISRASCMNHANQLETELDALENALAKTEGGG